jgi:hypothetical protein
MNRLPLALSISALLAVPALADDVADFMDALGKAATGAIVADAYMLACDAPYPDSQQARRDALAGWAHRVDLTGYYRFLGAAFGTMPDLAADLEENRVRAQTLVDDDVAKDGSTCTDLRSALNDNAMFDIERPIRYLLRNADDFGIVVAEADVAAPNDEIPVVPLISLSAQLAGKMDEIGSKAGAQDDRDLRKAREDHAEAWLGQRAALAIYGRIVGENSLREWRGDQQSAFSASCRSFADDAQEAAMARDLGQDRILVGEVRWVSDAREGGELSLDDCRVFVHDPAQVALTTIADESAGLMPRPLDYAEAFAGPGAGIALSDVERVLYDAEFANRMDGFGNGYTHRDEDIYVLLRDGTAYRHEWNFAFTDLAVGLSRQREPERWFTWQDNGGTVTLTQTGGLDAGVEIDMSEARRLMPVPEGQRLDETYYYLNVGMGGGRSDREYAFSTDGQLHYSRSGFVAGNFGTSYIIVAGDSGDEVSISSYEFNGYTLLIDGQERHFVALPDGEDPGRPGQIIIDGQVHWLREDDQ